MLSRTTATNLQYERTRMLPSFIQSLKKTSGSIDAGVVGSTDIAKLQCFGDWIISTPRSSGQSELSRDFHRVSLEPNYLCDSFQCPGIWVLSGDVFEGAVSICED